MSFGFISLPIVYANEKKIVKTSNKTFWSKINYF